MNKVWLIFGGSGFIGKNLILDLVKTNKIICVDFDKKNNSDLLKLLNQREKKNLTLIRKSIVNYYDIENIFKKYYFDIIINLAALTSVNETTQYPKKTKEINIKGFKNILNLMQKYKKEKIIYASSSAVYGENNFVNNEKMKLKPKSLYGKTKFENEKKANEFYKKFNILSVGLRFSNIYGKYQKSNSLYSAVISKWMHLLKLRKSIIIHDNKKILRDFCHVSDVVSSIKLSYNYLEKNHKAEIFNIAYGSSISLKVLLDNILQTLKKKNKHVKAQIKEEKTPKQNIIVSKISIKKAKIKLKYKPQIDIKRGLNLSF